MEKCVNPQEKPDPQHQSARMKQLNSSLGVNREDLPYHHDLEELEFQRALLQETLLNSVLGVQSS